MLQDLPTVKGFGVHYKDGVATLSTYVTGFWVHYRDGKARLIYFHDKFWGIIVGW